MGAGKKVKCLKCMDVIQSMYRHDFVSCKCGAIFVDGGDSYLSLGYPKGEVEDHLEILEDQ